MTREVLSRSAEIALHRYVTAVILFLFGAMLGCAMLMTAAGGAGGAILGGALGGPVGAVGGAAAGAGVTHAAVENHELRAGTLQGDGAADKEVERLKGLLGEAQVAARVAEQSKGLLERSFDRLALWSKWAAALVVGWLAFKYLFPWARSARNFWSGVAGLLRGEGRAALRKIVSSTGLAHTEKP